MKADLRGTLTVAVLYAALNAAIRLTAGTRLAMDDAKTNLFTQVWRWGYQADNPPLYEWLIKGLHLVTGGGLWSFLVLNAVCLVASAGFTHLAVRRFAGERAAFGTACGMVLLYQVGWNFHQAFTHSALLLAMVCAGVWAGLRLVRRRRPSDYVLFGAVLGLGFLAKYNFALFAGGFAVAALTTGPGRRALGSVWTLAALGIAGLIVLPHALWLWGRANAYTASLPDTLAMEAGRLAGVGSLGVAVISFFVPWVFVYGWLRWRFAPSPGRGPRHATTRSGPDPGASSEDLRDDRGHRKALTPNRRFGPLPEGKVKLAAETSLLLRTATITTALVLLGVLAFGIGAVSERYVIPVLLPAYAALSASLLAARPAALRPYLLASLAFAAAFSGVRLAGFLYPGPPFCGACRAFVPYGALTARLAEAVPPDAILLAREENTAGNLVAAFPQARVTSLNLLTRFNPATPADADRPCYYVWSEDMTGGVPLHPVFAFARTDPRTAVVDAAWPARGGLSVRRTVWGVTPLEGPLYARFCAHDAPG